MLLAADIGNTNITLGGFEGDRLVFTARLATVSTKTEDEYAADIMGIFALRSIPREKITGAIVASVVPPLNPVIKKAFSLLFGVNALLVGPGVKTGINIHCDTPSSVGADIICAAVAVKHFYGAPALVADFGTATKMLVIDRSGAFIGVSIIPGVAMGLDALSSGTAQLPRVSLEAPGSVVAKNTADCMRSGVIFGNAALTDGMISRIRDELGYELPVYATGGLAPLILPHCRTNIKSDPGLVLKGLNLIWQKNS
ncbi:MAG: type III pantothenate kinase [Ruminococcaceae bacterium]|nr:type III pantothenate kinase [Oscillospiraceae bacterium]